MAVFEMDEILRATRGTLVNGPSIGTATGITTDTRTLRPGEAFLALRGEKFDGHDYLQQAAEKGAAVFIVMDDGDSPDNIPVIRVADTLIALGDLAKYHRSRFQGPVVAITGSNGKTTTKEMAAAVLGSVWETVKTEKNFNNEIGLPMTLFRIEETTKACVVEMGMRGLGQIRALANIAEPTLGIITNVGVTHMELLGSQEAIAEAKGELAEALPESGQLILNADDPRVNVMSERSKARAYRYSLDVPADLYLKQRSTEGEGQHLSLDGRWGPFEAYLPALGRHNASNAMAALLTGLVLGISPQDAIKGLSELHLVDQRLRLRAAASGLQILDDTYNSSPPAVEAALEAMESIKTTGRRIAVLGDMLELGKTSLEAHAGVGRVLAQHHVEMVYAFGPLSEETARTAKEMGIFARHYLEMEPLIEDLVGMVRSNDLILVKGSRGMRMERVVEGLLRSDIK